MSTSIQRIPESCLFLAEVERKYAALMASAKCAHLEVDAAGPSQGGRLLYAGVLDKTGRALVVAGNIAGTATLVVTADPNAQKQAIRDGVVDFLVTSLNEALRILKNEIRKRQTVAVCVSAAPEVVEQEMHERGVTPDVRREEIVTRGKADLERGVCVNWSVAAMPAQWLPKLDALAADCLQTEAAKAGRWLRLAPRYLGRMAQGERLLTADATFAACFVERVRQKVESGEVTVSVTVRVCDAAECVEHQFMSAGEPASR